MAASMSCLWIVYFSYLPGSRKREALKKEQIFDHIDVAARASVCASVCFIKRLMGISPGSHISVPAPSGGRTSGRGPLIKN